MSEGGGLLIGRTSGADGIRDLFVLPGMANRHGLVAGATGTGKTVTLQTLAEAFSAIGVPVFAADVKGDLSGVSQPGGGNPKVEERVAALGMPRYTYAGSPVEYWDVFGQQGHPVRMTVSELGPLLLARLLNLNDTQEGVLTIAFKVADDNGLLLLNLKDLRAILQYVGDHSSELTTAYGNVSAASIGAIQRGLLTLESQGGEMLFGEPALDLFDFMQTDASGRGVINLLAADRLMTSPRTYATLLLWLLSELFERMPEVGDPEKPKLVFFFDEAHLLFDEAPDALLDKIEQVVRLIRSKGVGIWFVTQNPIDIPDKVLAQLGNKVQHALRSFTPADQKAVTAMAQTFRPNPNVDVESTVTALGVGEALVSLLQADGSPAPVERVFIVPPHGRIGPCTPQERTASLQASVLAGHYEAALDRPSAYELLVQRAQEQAAAEQQAALAAQQAAAAVAAQSAAAQAAAPVARPGTPAAPRGRQRETMLEAMGKSAIRAMGSQVGREIARGILGGVLGGVLAGSLGKNRR